MAEPKDMRDALDQIEELKALLINAETRANEFRKQIMSGANHYTVPKGGTMIIPEGTVIGSLFVSGGTVGHTVGEPVGP